MTTAKSTSKEGSLINKRLFLVFSKLNTRIKLSLRNHWGLLFSLVGIFLLLCARVGSRKYSLDTLGVFKIFHSILFDQSTLIYSEGTGWIHSLNLHFNAIYFLISPLYYLGPSILIFSWKFISYGGFISILWHLIDSDRRYGISNWHKNLFLLLVSLHPTFISNLIAPDIWDSDLILPFLALKILYISRARYGWGVFWFCLTFLIKEDMMLVGIMYGILMALLAKKVKYVWLSGFSLCSFWLVSHVVMPSFATSTENLGLLKFSFGNLGGSVGEIILNSIFHPHAVIANGWWMRKFASLFIILSCVGWLPFWNKRSIIYLLPALSVLGYTILAAQPYLDYSKHYMLALFVPVVWGSYESYILVKKNLRERLVLFSTSASIIIILVLQINVRVWSYYLHPSQNRTALKTVEEKYIPAGSYLVTAGLGSPWINYNNDYYISSSFNEDKIEKMEFDYEFENA